MAEPTPTSTTSRSAQSWQVGFARRGDSIDSLAAEIGKGNARFARMSLQERKAILIANNRVLETRPIEPGQVIDLAEFRTSGEASRLLQCDAPGLCRDFAGLSPDLQSLLQHAPTSAVPLGNFASTFRDQGWSVGLGADQLISSLGYGVQIADAGAGAAAKLLGDVQRSATQLSKELFTTFGPKVATSKAPSDLARVEQHLKSSRTYQSLRQAIERLPDFLKDKLGQVGPAEGVSSAQARWLRRDVTIPITSGTPARFMNRMAGSLDGAVTRFGRIGVATTWVLPALVGVYNVAQAPPQRRLRVGIEEGVGVGFGWLGGAAGLIMGTLLVTFLCLTGAGAFIVVALAAGAGSYFGGDIGKSLVRPALDFLEIR
jgi:hypothetical protein